LIDDLFAIAMFASTPNQLFVKWKCQVHQASLVVPTLFLSQIRDSEFDLHFQIQTDSMQMFACPCIHPRAICDCTANNIARRLCSDGRSPRSIFPLLWLY
jgi:hypothetical protein